MRTYFDFRCLINSGFVPRANAVVCDVVQPLWQSVLPLWGRYLSVFDVLRVLESFTRCSIVRSERRADRGHYILKVMMWYFKKHTLCHNEISFWGPNNGPSSGSVLPILFTSRFQKRNFFPCQYPLKTNRRVAVVSFSVRSGITGQTNYIAQGHFCCARCVAFIA